MLVVVVFVVALAAFAISAVAGGGAGLVLMPLLRLIVPIGSVPGALSIGTAASSISRIALFRKSIRWDVVRRFMPTALPSAALGAWLLTLLEPVYVELIIGCFLVANLPALFRKSQPESKSKLSFRWLPIIGAPFDALGRLRWLSRASRC
ncbi:MAG: sulfite exporter TauE/SafE family protein [Clostridia bacterium]|nr:sulfite exporter TauE/SafE family protein [Deltaproteobacteria bacterium]